MQAASANGSTIPSASQLVDSSHNIWTVNGGVVYQNGATAGYSANVAELLFLNGVIYQENSSAQWFSWTNNSWVATSNPTATSNPPSGGGSPSPYPIPTRTQALGMNLNAVGYASPSLPFLNLMKYAGSSSGSGYNNLGYYTGWYTASAGTFDTHEEGYLQLDANGYPTSLTASPTPPGGQQFTMVRTLMNYNLPALAPGQTSTYPAGSYRLKFVGQGTVVITGDASLTLTNTSPGTYVEGTFTVSSPGSGNGLQLEITAINSSTDYPRDISVVQSQYASDYDNGQLFNPAYLAAIAPFSTLRFMQWNNLDIEFTAFTVTAGAGAQSAALSGPWQLPTGTYPIVFIDGERRNGNFVIGSSTVTWSGGLSNAITSTYIDGNSSANAFANMWVDWLTWAKRPLPSNAFWTLAGGVPLEVEIALANELQANAYFDVPFLYSDSDIEGLGAAIMAGTGLQSGYGPLNSPLTAYIEYSNEVWNGIYTQAWLAEALGAATWPTATGSVFEFNRNYYGMRTAQMAADLQNAMSSTLFGRVIPVLGAQAANTYTATDSLATPYWSAGPAAKYPIKAVAIAPYWGGYLTNADCTYMTSQSDGGLADFFATLSSSTGASGHNYSSSVPSTGWLNSWQPLLSAYTGAMAAYPSMKLIAYEGGQNFLANGNPGGGMSCSNWPTLVTAAERDPRMGTAYTTYLNMWKNNVGGDAGNINVIFDDVYNISVYGAWGLLESVMQTLSPLSSAPPKYQAAVDYAE